MKTMPGSFAFSLIAAAGFLALCAGCYNPKADIDAFRPQAKKYFVALERVGKAVTAQPPLKEDTMAFPDAKQLRFADGPGGKQNATIIHVEELSDFGQMHIYDRIIDEEYYAPAYALLHSQQDPHVGKVTKEVVPWRFQQLLDIQYLVVLRVKKVYAEVTNAKEFTGGATSGEAFLYEVNDAATFHGGFSFAVRSSNEVALTVHGDAKQQEIDRKLAVRKDLDEQAEKLIHQKVKASLPGAGFPSYW